MAPAPARYSMAPACERCQRTRRLCDRERPCGRCVRQGVGASCESRVLSGEAKASGPEDAADNKEWPKKCDTSNESTDRGNGDAKEDEEIATRRANAMESSISEESDEDEEIHTLRPNAGHEDDKEHEGRKLVKNKQTNSTHNFSVVEQVSQALEEQPTRDSSPATTVTPSKAGSPSPQPSWSTALEARERAPPNYLHILSPAFPRYSRNADPNAVRYAPASVPRRRRLELDRAGWDDFENDWLVKERRNGKSFRACAKILFKSKHECRKHLHYLIVSGKVDKKSVMENL